MTICSHGCLDVYTPNMIFYNDVGKLKLIAHTFYTQFQQTSIYYINREDDLHFYCL